MKSSLISAVALAIAASAPGIAIAKDKVLNLYSARHYQTDDALYRNFTKKTGISIRLIEGKDSALLERIRAESTNSPADVLILADASRLWKAEKNGVFAPVMSDVLKERIPATLRSKDDGKGSAWFGFSRRARVIIYDKTRVKEGAVKTYADLAKPEFKGMVCTRTGAHPYMLSLIGSITEHEGVEATEKWAKAVVANFARKPRGGDTDQIRGVASGECAIAVANSYYYARLMRSKKAKDQKVVAATSFSWPNQGDRGTHVNVSGGGMLAHSPNKANAVKFLEYLASDAAQEYFANGNNEWPTVPSAKVSNPALDKLGDFKADNLSIAKIGAAQSAAIKIIDRAGWR